MVFNFIGNQSPNAGSNPVYNYYMSDNEKKLYEDKIKLLEQKCQYLEEENKKLKGK